MESRGFYNEILTEHNLRPEFKHDLPDADIVLEGVNPSCGDDIWLKLKVDGDVITDGAFVGDGCAISQASADIMLGMIIGKTKDEALRLGNLFLRMIKGEASEEEIEELEEAGALKDRHLNRENKNRKTEGRKGRAGKSLCFFGAVLPKVRKKICISEKKYHFTHLQFSGN